MDNYAKLKQISSELGLEFHPQDWGIANSNADRFDEFVNYFNNKSHGLENYCVMELFELIVASANDALLEDKLDENRRILFREVINANKGNELLKIILDYWKRNQDDDFPIGSLL